MSSDVFNINKVRHRLSKMGYHVRHFTWSDCAKVVSEVMSEECPTSMDLIMDLCIRFCNGYSPERCKSMAKAKNKRLYKNQKNGFYKSQAWREARYDALKNSGGACKLCGRSTRMHGVVLHVDHIQPISKRPDLILEMSNLQVLCEDCNLGKGNRDNTAF